MTLQLVPDVSGLGFGRIADMLARLDEQAEFQAAIDCLTSTMEEVVVSLGWCRVGDTIEVSLTVQQPSSRSTDLSLAYLYYRDQREAVLAGAKLEQCYIDCDFDIWMAEVTIRSPKRGILSLHRGPEVSHSNRPRLYAVK